MVVIDFLNSYSLVGKALTEIRKCCYSLLLMGLRWRNLCAYWLGFFFVVFLLPQLYAASPASKAPPAKAAKPAAGPGVDFKEPVDQAPANCPAEIAKLSNALGGLSSVNSSNGVAISYADWAAKWAARAASLPPASTQAPSNPHWSEWLAYFEGRSVGEGETLTTSRMAIEIVFRMARITEYERLKKIIPEGLEGYRWILADLNDFELILGVLNTVGFPAVAAAKRADVLDSIFKFLAEQRPHWKISNRREDGYKVFSLNAFNIVHASDGILYFARGKIPRDESGRIRTTSLPKYPMTAKLGLDLLSE